MCENWIMQVHSNSLQSLSLLSLEPHLFIHCHAKCEAVLGTDVVAKQMGRTNQRGRIAVPGISTASSDPAIVACSSRSLMTTGDPSIF